MISAARSLNRLYTELMGIPVDAHDRGEQVWRTLTKNLAEVSVGTETDMRDIEMYPKDANHNETMRAMHRLVEAIKPQAFVESRDIPGYRPTRITTYGFVYLKKD